MPPRKLILVAIIETRRQRGRSTLRLRAALIDSLDQPRNHRCQIGRKRFDRGIIKPQIEVVERELHDGFRLMEIALALDRIARRLKRYPQLVQREHAWLRHHEPHREAIVGDHDFGHQRQRSKPFETAQLFRDEIDPAADAGERKTAGLIDRRANQIDHEALRIYRSKRSLSLRLEGRIHVLKYPEQPSTANRTRQFNFRFRVQESVEIFSMKKPGFELYASRHLVGIHRVAAENYQMSAEQSARVERSHDVGGQSRNPIHSRGDAELGLPRDFEINCFDSRIEVAFSFGKFPVSLLGLGRARPKRAIAAMTVSDTDQVVVAGNLLPV